MKNVKGDKVDVHIRWMIRRDIAEVLAIENIVFEFPFEEKELIRLLRVRNCTAMVAEHDERVVGFMIYLAEKRKIDVIDFAVHPDFQRGGVGRQMVQKLARKLSVDRRNRITLEVRETNMAAQVFFQSMGFVATRLLRNYYEEANEDAYLFQYSIEPTPALEAGNRIGGQQ